MIALSPGSVPAATGSQQSELPTITNQIRDEERNITYTFTFMAYRKMTYQELVTGVAIIRGQKKRLKRNANITVLTIIGARD